MAKRSGVANIVNKKTGDKYTIRSTNLDRRIKDYFIKLEKGQHHNEYLQRDYDKYGMNVFVPEIVVADCKTQAEINRLGKLEIEKNGIKSYNIREDDVTFEGGDSEFLKGSRDDYSELLEYLNHLIDIYDIRDSTKIEIEFKIEAQAILTKDEICDEIKSAVKKDKLLKIINESNLTSKEKNELIKKVEKESIVSESKLKKEIDKFKNNSNNSSNNQRDKHQTSPNKSASLKNNNDSEVIDKKIRCPNCGMKTYYLNEFCHNCGEVLHKPYKSKYLNYSRPTGIIGRLFKINDKKTRELRYSKSKIISLIVYLVFFQMNASAALSHYSTLVEKGKFSMIIAIAIFSLIPYAICRIIGRIIRSKS